MIKLWLNWCSYFINKLQDLLVLWMQSNEISFSFDEDSDDDFYHMYCLKSEMRTEQELNCFLNEQSKSHDVILICQSLD